MLATDTDSATYQIFTERDPLLDMALANTHDGRYPCFFDLAKNLVEQEGGDLSPLSHLPADQLQLAQQRVGELGAFGLEYFPIWIDEFIGLRAKLYSLHFSLPLKDKLDKQRAKGVPKKATPRHEAYREAMSSLRDRNVEFFQLVGRSFQKGVERVSKKALSAFNDKVNQVNYLESRPHGHWRNRTEVAELIQLTRAWLGNSLTKLVMSFGPLES